MRCAGLPLGAHHHVGAAAKHALACPAAVLYAETLGFRGGGTARHGARLKCGTFSLRITERVTLPFQNVPQQKEVRCLK